MDSLPSLAPDQSSGSPSSPVTQTQQTLSRKKPLLDLKSKTTRLALVGAIFLLLFIIFLLLIFSLSKSNLPKKETATKTITAVVKKSTESSTTLTPYSQLQSAYTAVVGSDDVKKTLTLDASGVATIDYTITSVDGTTIIKTSYENFADLASRVFNIPGVERLNVTTYATRFNDQFGQPDQAALKLQITKTTSNKINWPLKKFSYKDYAVILDYHELNSLLQKDYEKLIKNK